MSEIILIHEQVVYCVENLNATAAEKAESMEYYFHYESDGNIFRILFQGIELWNSENDLLDDGVSLYDYARGKYNEFLDEIPDRFEI